MASAFRTPQSAAPKQAWTEPTPLTPARATHSEGFVYCCGSTEHGQLGLPHQREPIKVPRLHTHLMKEGVVQVSCGWRHTAFVSSSGNAFVCGDGKFGKLGCGDEAQQPEPCRVPFSAPVHVMSVSCGMHHTAFITTDRAVWTCGLGLYGQLGHGDIVSEESPRCLEAVQGSVVAAACGDYHTLLLSGEGKPLTCGYGEGGRLGLNPAYGEEGLGCVLTPREVELNLALRPAQVRPASPAPRAPVPGPLPPSPCPRAPAPRACFTCPPRLPRRRTA